MTRFATRSPSGRALTIAALAMPYLTIWMGLYIFHDAWAAVLGYHAGIVILVTLAGAWTRVHGFFASTSICRALLFGLLGWSAGASLYLLLPIIHLPPRLADALVNWGLTPSTWPIFIAYAAFINPWLEELYWRGWLGSESRRPCLHDAVFAGFHLVILAPFLAWQWLVVAFIILTASGWMWRQVTRAEESMLAAALFHMTADVSILVVILSEVT